MCCNKTRHHHASRHDVMGVSALLVRLNLIAMVMLLQSIGLFKDLRKTNGTLRTVANTTINWTCKEQWGHSHAMTQLVTGGDGFLRKEGFGMGGSAVTG
jgi:hypothetical protein